MKTVSVIFITFSLVFSDISSKRNSERLNKIIKAALNGLRIAMTKGDAELGIPILDPYYTNSPMRWNHYDRGVKIFLRSENRSIFEGFSAYEVEYVNADMVDLDVEVKQTFSRVKTSAHYFLDGYALSGYLPIIGNGSVSIRAINVTMCTSLKMSLNQSFVQIDDATANYTLEYFNVNAATNLLSERNAGDLTNAVLKDVIRSAYVKYNLRRTLQNVIGDATYKLARNVFEDMTLPQLLDYVYDIAEKYSGPT